MSFRARHGMRFREAEWGFGATPRNTDGRIWNPPLRDKGNKQRLHKRCPQGITSRSADGGTHHFARQTRKTSHQAASRNLPPDASLRSRRAQTLGARAEIDAQRRGQKHRLRSEACTLTVPRRFGGSRSYCERSQTGIGEKSIKTEENRPHKCDRFSTLILHRTFFPGLCR